jgi:hypothetical protein
LVPEVQGRSLEEIEEMFDRRLPAKDFTKYVSQNVEIARAQAEKDIYGKEGEKGAALHVEDASRV